MKSEPKDPFKKDREESGIKNTIFNREEIPFVLRLKDLRKTVKDWQSFSSDHPFKVVPHTEEKMRSMRQIPIEMDPPDHTEYRTLVEPFFKRPNNLEYIKDRFMEVPSFETRFYKAISHFLSSRLRGLTSKPVDKEKGALDLNQLDANIDKATLERVNIAGERFNRLLSHFG